MRIDNNLVLYPSTGQHYGRLLPKRLKCFRSLKGFRSGSHQTFFGPKPRWREFWRFPRHQSAIVLFLLLVGCTTDEAPKTSLFEHDHHVAAHWPRDLTDLLAKLRARIASVKNGTNFHQHDHHHEHDHHHPHEHGHHHEYDHEYDHEQAPVPLRDQIEDLVDWVAEIAADTNLAEADWIPLYEKSQTVSANLNASSGELSDDELRELDSLCQLINDSIPKIREPFASTTKVAL